MQPCLLPANEANDLGGDMSISEAEIPRRLFVETSNARVLLALMIDVPSALAEAVAVAEAVAGLDVRLAHTALLRYPERDLKEPMFAAQFFDGYLDEEGPVVVCGAAGQAPSRRPGCCPELYP